MSASNNRSSFAFEFLNFMGYFDKTIGEKVFFQISLVGTALSFAACSFATFAELDAFAEGSFFAAIGLLVLFCRFSPFPFENVYLPMVSLPVAAGVTFKVLTTPGAMSPSASYFAIIASVVALFDVFVLSRAVFLKLGGRS